MTDIDLTRLVKPLVWVPDTGHFVGRSWNAETRFGEYFIFQDDEDDLFRWGNLVTLHNAEADKRDEYPTLELAQSAANADHAARVLASLDVAVIEELVQSCIHAVADSDENERFMVCHWVDDMRATLAKLKGSQP